MVYDNVHVHVHLMLILTSSVAQLMINHGNFAMATFNCYMHFISVAIDCSEGAIRLVGGASKYDGRVEVCINKIWGTVCAGGTTPSDAQKICTSRGFSDQGEKVVCKILIRTCFGQESLN